MMKRCDTFIVKLTIFAAECNIFLPIGLTFSGEATNPCSNGSLADEGL